MNHTALQRLLDRQLAKLKGISKKAFGVVRNRFFLAYRNQHIWNPKRARYAVITVLATAGVLLVGAHGTANGGTGDTTAFFDARQTVSDALFASQTQQTAAESPDLELVQGSFVYGVSAPAAISAKALGDVVGSDAAPQTAPRNDVLNYTVQQGDTSQSVADKFGISLNTVLWANNLSKNQALKPGQALVILPVSGVIHVVKAGDTVSDIAVKYKSSADAIVQQNNLASIDDIFTGDVLIIPGGTMPAVRSVAAGVTGASAGFIYPLLHFIMTQGLHYYNAVDLASKCGDPVFAVAAGTVQRAVDNNEYNLGMGNYVTILHRDGVTTYYGHLSRVLVSPGQSVVQGDRIGLEGETGDATGCHVHFQVMGASNYVAQQVRVGQTVDVTK